jgi:hypothetical protein
MVCEDVDCESRAIRSVRPSPEKSPARNDQPAPTGAGGGVGHSSQTKAEPVFLPTKMAPLLGWWMAMSPAPSPWNSPTIRFHPEGGYAVAHCVQVTLLPLLMPTKNAPVFS